MVRGGVLAGKEVVEGASPRARPDSAAAMEAAGAGVEVAALGRSPKSITFAGAPPVGGAPEGSAGTEGEMAGAGAGFGAGVAGGAGVGAGRGVEEGATEGSGVERGAEEGEVGRMAGVGVEAGACEAAGVEAGAGVDRGAALPVAAGAGAVTGGNPGFWKGADPSPKREGAGAMPPKGGGDLAGKLVMLGSLITPGARFPPAGGGVVGRVWAAPGAGVAGVWGMVAGWRGTPAPGSGAVVPPLEGSLMIVACLPPKPPPPTISSAARACTGSMAASSAAMAGRASGCRRLGGGDVAVMTSRGKRGSFGA